MHIANVIVNCRAHLAHAEIHYSNGHKGNAAEVLAALSALLQKELPGITTEPDPPESEQVNQPPAHATKKPDSMIVVKPVEPDPTS